MSQRLSKEEVVTILVLAERGMNHCEIGRQIGVTEGAVRHHLRRAREGRGDGRKNKSFKVEPLAGVIASWHAERADDKRPVNVMELFEYLVEQYGFEGSYQAVRRFVRRHYPQPGMRTYRRVETPPGAQTQTDWAVFPRVDIGEGPEPLSAFVMVLSHSRKPAVVWSRRQDQLSWLRCHNEAYRRLQGVAAVNRIDNVKTAISRGAGAWGVIHPAYRAYAQAVGFHIDACQPGQANAKGKVEAAVRVSRLRADPSRIRHDGVEGLQAWSDGRVTRWCERSVCPATGRPVDESWEAEIGRLAPLPILPEPFDVAVTRPVRDDCLLRFEGRYYPVPFAYAGRRVEVRGCADTVQIMADGKIIKAHPRHTPEQIIYDPSCWEGASTDRVQAPPPLGKMGRKLQEIMEMPVEHRPVDLYGALAEVAR